MTLSRYIATRFFTYIFFINAGLTLLFGLIEFFEKMMRTQQATVGSILYFIVLSLVPSFFENLPIASWLATCMLIKEMHQQNEWDLIKLLNIPLKKIFFLILFCATALATAGFVGKEFVSYRTAQKAEEFKQEQFKQKKNTKIFNQWFMLKEQTFCHFQYLDIETNKGDSISLFEVSPQFSIEKITMAKKFKIDSESKKITIEKGTTILTKSKKQISLENESIFLPRFFTQLNMAGHTPKFTRLLRIVIFGKKSLPTHVYHQLLYLFLQRILIHLLLILYPLLTIALFLAAPIYGHYRWVLIFLPYPLFILSSTLTDSAMQIFNNGALAIVPYTTLLLPILWAYNTMRKE